MDKDKGRTGLRVLVEAVEADLAKGCVALAYLVPTTASIIRFVEAAKRKHPALRVVGPMAGGNIAPAKLLAGLRSGSIGRTPVLVFSDQLVGPDVATIPRSVGEKVEYMSALEAVMLATYGYTLKAAVSGNIERVEPPGSVPAAVSFLAKYFEEADALAETWLLREHQESRLHEGRLREAKLRSRCFQSSVFHLYSTRSLDASGRSALKAVDEVMQRLAEAG